VPVLFDKKKFEELLDLGDEEGAKKVIQKNVVNVSALDFPEGAVDLDTMDDYFQFNKKNPQ
jgi:molybdenum cofactor cytidylyltransferase